MAVVYRPGDSIRIRDDVVLRAGGGAVDVLLRRALDNAPDYEALLHARLVKSAFTVSVHVPRGKLPTAADVLADPFYRRYRAYLDAPAETLVELPFVEVVATTIVTPGEAPSAIDLCHFDIVIEATDERQLRQRLETVVRRFTRHVR